MARIEVGDSAPEFTLDSVNMGEVTLSNYSRKSLVMIFGRYFGCPVCQLDFDELIEQAPGILEKAGLIYFTQSSRESALRYLEASPVSFPVVPVSIMKGHYKVYDDYGVGSLGPLTLAKMLNRARVARSMGKVHGEYEGRETQSPGDFIVDGKGILVWVNRGLLDLRKIIGVLNTIG